MNVTVRAVLPGGAEVVLPAFETLAVSRIVSLSWSPNTDPEDDRDDELTMTVELSEVGLIDAVERSRYYGHLGSCLIVTTPVAQHTTRTRCTCGKGSPR